MMKSKLNSDLYKNNRQIAEMTLIHLLSNNISLRRPKNWTEVENCRAFYSHSENLGNPDAFNDSSSFPLRILQLYRAYHYQTSDIQFILDKLATKLHQGSKQAPLIGRIPI